MRRASLWSVVSVVLLWAGTAEADLNNLLHGDYAFTGDAACIGTFSPLGFNPNLTPVDGRFGESFSTQGVRTFNGDGTGTFNGISVAVTQPDTPVVLGGASSSNFQGSFTYVVAPDGTFTTNLGGPLTGTILTGTRAGQTFTVDTIPLSGSISGDHKTLTATSVVPTIETVTYSNGDVLRRICHRSRVLLRLKRGDD